MSKWGDAVLKIASSNPDVRVVDNADAPAIPHEYVCGLTEVHPKHIRTATEAEEQIALFTWIDAHKAKHPALAWAFHVPNGEFRHPATAGRLAAMGVRRGVPDVLLPCLAHDAEADRTYVGLAIELKRADHSNHTTPEQDDWLAWLDSQEWRSVVCYGAAEAIRVIKEYLGMEVDR
jgi:hypothetical protein